MRSCSDIHHLALGRAAPSPQAGLHRLAACVAPPTPPRRKNSKTAWAALLAASSLALAGCLVPEKFTATATFKPDGSYRYQYDGTVVNAFVLMAERDGKIKDSDRAKLQTEMDREAKRPGVKKLKRLDEARYELVFDDELKPGARISGGNGYDVLRVKADERVLTVTGPELRPQDQQAFADLKIAMEGKIAVIPPKGAEVISHNATGTPGLLSKAYTWSVGSYKDKPSIQFRLP